MSRNVKWLVLDATYLCHRSFYSTGPGGNGVGLENGLIFGFLRDLAVFQSTHNSCGMIFCFDHGKSLRCKDFPYYKYQRSNIRHADYERKLTLFKQQTEKLKKSILKDIGFRNVFYEAGYEADDLIARLCPNREAVIISSDKDLYQVLTNRVSMWNPIKKEFYTKDDLMEEYGVSPEEWAEVKALAGCRSDNIPGIDGIGDKTAARYLKGSMHKDCSAYCKITTIHSREMILRNRKLTKLPYPGTPSFPTKKDSISDTEWRKVMEKLGFSSLRLHPPVFCQE